MLIILIFILHFMNNLLLEKNNSITIKFKNNFKNLNFYSIPTSILFIVRKRLNLVFILFFFVIFFLFSFN